MPKRSAHHALDSTLLSVGKLHGRFLFANARIFATDSTNLFLALARRFGSYYTGVRHSWDLYALARREATLLAKLGFDRFAVPFRIVEMEVCLHEIVDREIVLAIVEPDRKSTR